MDRLLVDTNIVIDLLARREDFYVEAQELFTLADRGEVELSVSALTFANIYYILCKHHASEHVRKALNKLKILVKTLPVDDKIIELALHSDFKDFEDAIQYHSALQNHLDMIITRNKKDFKHSRLPVFTAREYLNAHNL
ncbi:PIN domain-containing protein [Parabacteroides sp. PF5-6]|uniref:type II toxin-antitoxin system VapC family toxin n=1 Tax=Parabacteroides sp. PF5-6 TaxID=1742403 RepID=UPI002406069C|nr:PIN domain-containing protein [Parabacteroides sp. PF5-6]MDF9830988.1 putative nucleic acid-binding protein [Parabacteroides sp. PF5-6]